MKNKPIKIDAICNGCDNKITSESIDRLNLQSGSNGGHMLHHDCPDSDTGGTCLVWLQPDNVWRKLKPQRRVKNG